MNTQIPDHRTPMLNSQYYDDSKLQRRTKFLVSGLLLCFVIGVASLGMSIMILMKNQDLPELINYVKKAPQSEKIITDLDAANHRITALQKQIEEMRIQLEKHLQSLADVKIINSNNSEKLHDHSHHGDLPLGGSPVETHEHHHGSEDKNNISSEPLERNLDIFFIHEGSGDGDQESDESVDYGSEEEGSGGPVKCVVFPTPYCPDGHIICWTDDKCPVPFCCSSDTTA